MRNLNKTLLATSLAAGLLTTGCGSDGGEITMGPPVDLQATAVAEAPVADTKEEAAHVEGYVTETGTYQSSTVYTDGTARLSWTGVDGFAFEMGLACDGRSLQLAEVGGSGLSELDPAAQAGLNSELPTDLATSSPLCETGTLRPESVESIGGAVVSGFMMLSAEAQEAEMQDKFGWIPGF